MCDQRISVSRWRGRSSSCCIWRCSTLKYNQREPTFNCRNCERHAVAGDHVTSWLSGVRRRVQWSDSPHFARARGTAAFATTVSFGLCLGNIEIIIHDLSIIYIYIAIYMYSGLRYPYRNRGAVIIICGKDKTLDFCETFSYDNVYIVLCS